MQPGVHTSGAAQAKVPKQASAPLSRWSPAPACIIFDRPTSLIFASASCATHEAQSGCVSIYSNTATATMHNALLTHTGHRSNSNRIPCKYQTTACLTAVSMMFLDLRSQWTMRLECRKASPRATSSATWRPLLYHPNSALRLPRMASVRSPPCSTQHRVKKLHRVLTLCFSCAPPGHAGSSSASSQETLLGSAVDWLSHLHELQHKAQAAVVDAGAVEGHHVAVVDAQVLHERHLPDEVRLQPVAQRPPPRRLCYGMMSRNLSWLQAEALAACSQQH
jgi:hypothetical protein